MAKSLGIFSSTSQKNQGRLLAPRRIWDVAPALQLSDSSPSNTSGPRDKRGERKEGVRERASCTGILKRPWDRYTFEANSPVVPRGPVSPSSRSSAHQPDVTSMTIVSGCPCCACRSMHEDSFSHRQGGAWSQYCVSLEPLSAKGSESETSPEEKGASLLAPFHCTARRTNPEGDERGTRLANLQATNGFSAGGTACHVNLQELQG